MKKSTQLKLHNLKSFNREAKKRNLKLTRHPTGYFYWIGLTDEVSDAIAGYTVEPGRPDSTSIYIFSYAQLNAEQWRTELKYACKLLNIDENGQVIENVTTNS